MNQIKYMPIIKTGDAELRAVTNLPDSVKNQITPLFELTRSRISPKKEHGDIYRRLEKLKEVYGDREFCLDLTTISELSNYQIEDLQDSRKNYSKWTNFLITCKEEFPQIIPVIMFEFLKDETEEVFYSKLKSQLEQLDGNFNRIVYRFPYDYLAYEDDMRQFCEKISSKKLVGIIDVQFMPKESVSNYTPQVKPIIKNLKKYKLNQIVLATSSFPKIPTDYGGKDAGEFPLEKLELFNNFNSIAYGDYATIHPIRSSQAGGNGWIPRIDMPTINNTIFYFRSKKTDGEKKYSSAYVRVARKIVSDPRYKKSIKKIGGCWGIEQIELAADGQPQGLSPSFWISVRMNIHITLRTKILNAT